MKVLAVFSGGLDSMVSAQLVRSQGIEVQGLFFETPFFPSARAVASAASISLPLKIIDITKTHLEMVKNPRHGRGSNMNPCIDCHAMMLSEAGKMLESEGAGFLITGEVLGQRPMSQNKRALAIVAAESGFDGLIVRPLSARLLPPPSPSSTGGSAGMRCWPSPAVPANHRWSWPPDSGSVTFPAPAGGCLLTDVIFSKRLKDLLDAEPNVHVREIELLKVGRHFRVAPRTKLVVGRNQKENERIEALTEDGDLLAQAESVPGPSVLAIGELTPGIEEIAASITVAYSDARGNGDVAVVVERGGAKKAHTVPILPKTHFRKYMIE